MLLPAAEAPDLVSGLDADTPRCVSCPAPLLRAVSDQRGGDDHHVLLDDPLGDLAPKAKQLAKRAFALAFGHCRAADDGAPPAGPGGRREPAAAAPLGRSAFAKLLPALLGAGSYDDASPTPSGRGPAATRRRRRISRAWARGATLTPGGEERAAAALAHHAVGAGDAELACEAAAGLAALGGATFVAAFATVAVLGAPAPAQSVDVPLAPDEVLAPRRATALLASLPAYRGALDALRAAQVATTLLKAADKFLAKLKLPATDDADPADFEAGGALA
ncbi:hypothetical protein SO694_00040070 [Aureococcus anophagefferens]|uniref:Uncharacterized protein n=1 Tax=Aureococcus anophagefferens TaxID=44056 RepID=A0ABR1G6C2_AURAN